MGRRLFVSTFQFIFSLWLFIKIIFGHAGCSLQQGHSLVVGSSVYASSRCGPPIAVASLVTEHRISGSQASVSVAWIWSTGSVVVAEEMNELLDCIWDRPRSGLEPYLIHWMLDCWSHQESPQSLILEPGVDDSGRPGRRKLFHKQEAERQAGRIWSQEVLRGSRCATLDSSLGGTQACNPCCDRHVPWLPVVWPCLPSTEQCWHRALRGLTPASGSLGSAEQVRPRDPGRLGFGPPAQLLCGTLSTGIKPLCAVICSAANRVPGII